MLAVFESLYDEKSAFNAYTAFYDRSTRSNLNKFSITIAPLIKAVLLKKFPGHHDTDSLISKAFFAVYEASLDCPDIHTPKELTGFFWRTIVNAMIDETRSWYKPLPYEFVDDYPLCSRTVQPADIDRKIHAEQLRELVIMLLERDLPFTGDKKSACMFVAKSFLGGSVIDSGFVKSRFRLSKKEATYVIQYTRVALRILTVELNEA